MNIIIGKNKLLQLLEALQFRQVRMRYYVIETDILETDLLHCLLEITIIQHF